MDVCTDERAGKPASGLVLQTNSLVHLEPEFALMFACGTSQKVIKHILPSPTTLNIEEEKLKFVSWAWVKSLNKEARKGPGSA